MVGSVQDRVAAVSMLVCVLLWPLYTGLHPSVLTHQGTCTKPLMIPSPGEAQRVMVKVMAMYWIQAWRFPHSPSLRFSGCSRDWQSLAFLSPVVDYYPFTYLGFSRQGFSV